MVSLGELEQCYSSRERGRLTEKLHLRFQFPRLSFHEWLYAMFENESDADVLMDKWRRGAKKWYDDRKQQPGVLDAKKWYDAKFKAHGQSKPMVSRRPARGIESLPIYCFMGLAE